jgi:hypothetical protein
VDEGTDILDTTHLAIFILEVGSCLQIRQLSKLVPMEGTLRIDTFTLRSMCGKFQSAMKYKQNCGQ